MASLYEQLKVELEQEQAPSLYNQLKAEVEQEAEQPSLARGFTASALQRTGALGGAAGDVFGEGLGLNTVADWITSKLTGEDPEKVRQAREAFTASEEATIAQKLALPEPETKTQAVAQMAGSILPDLALGVASAPIFTAGKAAAAGAGARPLVSTFAGEAAQSAALAPLEFATRPPGEAAAITALAPILGTAVSRGASGLAQILKRSGAKSVAKPAVQTFGQEAAGRAMARIRQDLVEGRRPNFGDMLEMGLEENDPIILQMAREARMDAYRKGVASLRRSGSSDSEIAEVAPRLQNALGDRDPTESGIIADSLEALPPQASKNFAHSMANGIGEKGAKFTAKVREAMMGAMFSGFGTPVRVAMSNLINLGTKFPRDVGSVMIDLPRALGSKVLTGQAGRQRFFTEVPAEMYGMMRGLPRALKTAGMEARALRETQERAAIPGMAGQIIRVPLRILDATDQFFHGLGFNAEIYRQAARKARQEGYNLASPQKLANRIEQIVGEQANIAEGIAKQRTQIAKVKELLKQAPEGIPQKELARMAGLARKLETGIKSAEQQSFIKSAAELADRLVFANREGSSRVIKTEGGRQTTIRQGAMLDRVLDDLDYYARYFPVIDAVLPVRRSPANELRELVRHSPAGFVGGAVRAFKSATEGVPTGQIQGRLADDMSQALLGTAAMYGLLHLAATKQLRVNPFKEARKAERVTEESAGVVPDSVILGNYSIPISRLGPIGSITLAAAKVADLKEGEAPPPNLVAEIEKMTQILATTGANEAFFDPLSEFFEAVTGNDQMFDKWAQGVGGRFIPRAVSQFNPVIKEPVTPEDVAKTGLPPLLANMVAGARRQIPGTGRADLGLFGRDREVQAKPLSIAIGRSGELSNNPIAQEMVKVGAFHLPPNGLSKDFKTGLERRGIGYSTEEDRELRIVKGRVQELAVKNMIQSPGYQALPPTPQGDAIRKRLIDKAFEEASKAVDGWAKALKLAKVPLTSRNILGK